MAKCELEIILDQKSDIIRLGDQVGGTVRVAVNETCQCSKLLLNRFWKVSGPNGFSNSGGLETMILFEGQWHAG